MVFQETEKWMLKPAKITGLQPNIPYYGRGEDTVFFKE